ncbi:hypothetical protein [Paraburkholderia sp. C35]|uniref:hypothetical protein n=1 Tax=Paraburkholderia sp. C35 TaxID=2126993 RepID=UPI000D694CBF|nr:hypothetical protein [Paraburkholderia sp. C35]
MGTVQQQEKRDQVGAQRYTKSEQALQEAQAKAEGYASVDIWRRDVTIKASEFGNIVRDGVRPVIEQAQNGIVDLAREVASSNRAMLDQGLIEIRGAAQASVSPAALAEAFEPVLIAMERRMSARNEAQIKEGINAIQTLVMQRLDVIRASSEALRADVYNYVSALVNGPEAPAEETPPQTVSDIHAQAARRAQRGA